MLAAVNGNTAFLRSILPLGSEVRPEARELDRRGPDLVFPVESLARTLLAAFGWTLEFSAFQSNSVLPRMTIARHRNMFFFTVFARDTASSIAIRTPLGVPLLDEMETEYTGSRAVWHPGKCLHKRCRVFVDQAEDSVFSLKIETAGDFALTDRFSITGLNDAAVRIFLPEESLNRLEWVPDRSGSVLMPRLPYEIEDTEFGKCAVRRHVSGVLSIGVMDQEF